MFKYVFLCLRNNCYAENYSRSLTIDANRMDRFRCASRHSFSRRSIYADPLNEEERRYRSPGFYQDNDASRFRHAPSAHSGGLFFDHLRKGNQFTRLGRDGCERECQFAHAALALRNRQLRVHPAAKEEFALTLYNPIHKLIRKTLVIF